VRASGLIGPGRRSAVAVLSVGRHLDVSEGFGVPVVECRLLGRRSRVRRSSGCQYRRRGWRQLGRPGPRCARHLARARGSVYRPRHGTPCPPLLPPRRPLAKREQRRERFVYLELSCPRPLEESRFSRSCPRPPARFAREIAIGRNPRELLVERPAMMAGKWFVKKLHNCDEEGLSGEACRKMIARSPPMIFTQSMIFVSPS